MGLSSAISVSDEGVWLEVGHSRALFGDDRGLAEKVHAIADQLSCAVVVVIADRPETARLLSRVSRRSPMIVAPGHDAKALETLPLEVLEAPPQALIYLARLGIRTAGALSRLSQEALRKRLGPEGARLVRLARAEALALPKRYIPPKRPKARRELEPPIPPSEAILFLVKTVLDELTMRLSGRGLAIAALRLTLSFEDGSIRTEELLLPRPLRTTAPLLAIIQERLLTVSTTSSSTSDAPRVFSVATFPFRQADWPARIVAIEAQVLRTAEAPKAQLDMFSREELDAEELTALLARLTNTLGHDKVFAAELVPTHRPEAAWRRAHYLDQPASTLPQQHERRKQPKQKSKLLQKHEHEHAEPPSPRPIFVLPAPLSIHGELHDGATLRWQDGGGVVRAVWGPERLRGHWWSTPFDRDYHVVDLHDGARIWLFRDRKNQELYLQGIFD